MSRTPYPAAEVFFGSHPLLESTDLLGAGALLNSNEFDTVTFLPTRHSAAGFGGGNPATIYDDDAKRANDPRYFLDYMIYAEGATGVPAPGDLLVFGQINRPATPPDTTVGTQFLRHIRYCGNRLVYGQNNNGYTVADGLMTGTLRLSARRIFLTYFNNTTVQTKFRIGVYLRPV